VDRPARSHPDRVDPLVTDDLAAAYRTAAAAADRFRDVLCEVLGHDLNPGDDLLIAELRTRFGRTGPEPTRWRDRLDGYRARLAELGYDTSHLA
jgi:hypothetical protein